MNGWNTNFLLGNFIFRGCVSFREGMNSRVFPSGWTLFWQFQTQRLCFTRKDCDFPACHATFKSAIASPILAKHGSQTTQSFRSRSSHPSVDKRVKHSSSRLGRTCVSCYTPWNYLFARKIRKRPFFLAQQFAGLEAPTFCVCHTPASKKRNKTHDGWWLKSPPRAWYP